MNNDNVGYQDPEAVKLNELSEAPDEPPTPYPGQYSSTPTTEYGPTPGNFPLIWTDTRNTSFLLPLT